MSKFKVQSNKGPWRKFGFCQVEIFFLIILFFIWRFDCTDLMSRILSSSNHMNLATLDALHGKGLM